MTSAVERVELPDDPSSASRARAVVTGACAAVGIESDSAALCTSELVTNALLHGSPPVSLEVEIDLERAAISVRVRDGGASPVEPRRPVSAETLSGRGLTIVDALAARWGSEMTPEGNVAWFEIAAGDTADR